MEHSTTFTAQNSKLMKLKEQLNNFNRVYSWLSLEIIKQSANEKTVGKTQSRKIKYGSEKYVQ